MTTVFSTVTESMFNVSHLEKGQFFQSFLFHSASGGLGICDPAGQEGMGSDVRHRRKRRESQVPHG